MAESFDPYHIWLGIPPAEQPADHYRLLGISRFESHEDVISNAADQRVRHIRSMQTGKRQAETQRLLNEISAACGVLLDREKRKAYDAKLKAKEAARQSAAIAAAVTAASLSEFAPLSDPSLANSVAPAAPRAMPQPLYGSAWQTAQETPAQFPLVPIVIAAVSAVLLVIVVGIGSSFFRSPKPNAAASGKTAQPAEPSLQAPQSIEQVSNTKSEPPPPLPSPVSQPNLEHQKNWEYGYGRLDATGKVIEYHPFVYSQMDDDLVVWSTELEYPIEGPLAWLRLEKEWGHAAPDPSVVAIRRWRCSKGAVIKVRGEVSHVSQHGDGIRAYLVTSQGETLWKGDAKHSKAMIATREFTLQAGETLDLCVDCNSEATYDGFKTHLILDVRDPGGETETWDSLEDYRDPPK